MQLSPAGKARLSAPILIAVAIIAAGLYAIVWTVQRNTAGSTDRIEQAVQDGAAAVKLPSYANDALGSMPAFSLDLKGAVAIEPINMDQWMDTEWMNTIRDVDGKKWVWAGAWFGCMYINDDYIYEPDGTGDAPVAWDALVFRDQQTVKKECES